MMANDPLVLALKDALTPNPDRLPQELVAAIMTEFGQRVGMKEARRRADAYVHPDAIEAIRKVLAHDKENAKKALARAAIGAKRKFLLVLALLQIDDDPIAERIIRDLLRDPSDPLHERLVQSVGRANKPERFLPELHELALQRGSTFWASVVTALGAIGHPGSTTILIPQWDDSPEALYVLIALRRIAAQDARPVFADAAHTADPQVRLSGFWGLAKLGDAEAAKTLVAWLDQPGRSRDASRALADIHGWPIENTAKSHDEIVAKAKAHYQA
jgi:HEAT repeat protein